MAVVLTVLSFAVFHITALGVVFVIAAVILLALLLWCAWIRRQYAFGGGGMMERTHLVILSHLDFDGQGQLLEVGCGSGPLSIRAALTWPSAQVVGIDYWGVDFGYNQTMCEKKRCKRRCSRPVPVPAWGRQQAGLPGRELRRCGEQLCLS